jgi:hypothetical protein
VLDREAGLFVEGEPVGTFPGHAVEGTLGPAPGMLAAPVHLVSVDDVSGVSEVDLLPVLP